MDLMTSGIRRSGKQWKLPENVDFFTVLEDVIKVIVPGVTDD